MQLVDSVPVPLPEPAAVLRRIAAEAVILQDQAEAVLAAVARHERLGAVAPRGGPLVSRFFRLREQLPTRCADPRLDRLRAVLDTIFYHHAMQLAVLLDGYREEFAFATPAQQRVLGPLLRLVARLGRRVGYRDR